MYVVPRTVPGSLNPQNYKTADRGWQNHVAYGCQNSVVVVDPQTVQGVQTLTNGTANITKVRWSKECYHHTLASPYLLRLASVNSASLCAVWDVSQACVLAEFTLGQKQVHDIQWLSTSDSSRDLLAALIAPSQLCIWNADTGHGRSYIMSDVRANN